MKRNKDNFPKIRITLIWIVSILAYFAFIGVVLLNRALIQPDKTYWENGRLIEKYSSVYYTSFEAYKYLLGFLVFVSLIAVIFGIMNRKKRPIFHGLCASHIFSIEYQYCIVGDYVGFCDFLTI